MSFQADVAPLPELTKSRAWQAPEGAIGKSRERLAWLLVLPSLLVVALVALYPLYETIRLSFTNTRLASAREPRGVGLDNYQSLLTESAFRDSLSHTVVFTAASVTFETLLGLAIALVIHSNFRGRGGVRTAMLVPWAIPTVVSASMWQWMYHDVFGVVNDILVNRFHVLDTKVAWLASPTTALPAIIAVDVWKTTPFMALLLLAGLQLIPGDVYEASTVDGASKIQQFFQITLPLLKPALLVALIFRTLDAFRVFDVVYVMKQFAPETMTVAVYARQQLIDLQLLGRGSAAAVIIFLCIFAFVILYTRLIRVEEL
jgi:trehalose/maltose transport system permease protein